MESELYGIGSMARQSGLTVSALRFYDGAGILTPAWVDPHTGYRWYRESQLGDARLIAKLRRVGMPLNDICQVRKHQQNRQAAEHVLDAHLRRLEDGLTAARRELSSVRALLTPTEEHPMNTSPTTAIVASTELAAALRAVRYAASVDPELPMLSGVLLELDQPTAAEGPQDPATAMVRVVATDRYRLASSAAPAQLTGPPASVLVPIDLVDELLESLLEPRPEDEHVTVSVEVDGRRITFTTPTRQVTGDALNHEFPDHRRALDFSSTRQASIDVAGLRRSVLAATTRTMTRESDGARYETAVLTVQPSGSLTVAETAADQLAAGDTATGLRIGVNREFLLQALDAGGASELVIDLDGPIAPLAIRNPQRPDWFSVLMPVRLQLLR